MNLLSANFWDAIVMRGLPVGRPIIQTRARYFMAHAVNPTNPEPNMETMEYPNPGRGVSGESSN